MEPPDDKPDNPNEPSHRGDEEGPSTPWLPPEDRLWRHPSEVRAHPTGAGPGRAQAIASLVRAPRASTWLVALASGCVGALITAGILLASGAVTTNNPPAAPIRTVEQQTVPRTSSGATLTSVLDQVDPSVVGVTVTGPQGPETSSGVIVTTSGADSYILTDSNQFAGLGPEKVQITTYWGASGNARLVGLDPPEGIALLKAVLVPVRDVSTPNLGSVANVQDGEEVICVGSLNVAGSNGGTNFTVGYMGDVSSYVQPENGASDGMFSLLVANMNVSDCADGGALVDTNGNVLGIVVPVGQSSQVGLVYLAPIDIAMADTTAMMKDGQPATHAWLGILGATDLSGPGAQQLGLDGAVEVESVAAGSPAARAGIVDNDVVTSLDGHVVGSVGALIEWLANDAKPGEVVNVGWRGAGGSRWSKNITLETQPGSANPS